MEPKNNDARLKKSLMCKYDKTVHPSLTNEPVTVTLKMILKGFSFVSVYYYYKKKIDYFDITVGRLDFYWDDLANVRTNSLRYL